MLLSQDRVRVSLRFLVPARRSFITALGGGGLTTIARYVGDWYGASAFAHSHAAVGHRRGGFLTTTANAQKVVEQHHELFERLLAHVQNWYDPFRTPRRGRQKGSKNKTTIERELLAAHVAARTRGGHPECEADRAGLFPVGHVLPCRLDMFGFGY